MEEGGYINDTPPRHICARLGSRPAVQNSPDLWVHAHVNLSLEYGTRTVIAIPPPLLTHPPPTTKPATTQRPKTQHATSPYQPVFTRKKVLGQSVYKARTTYPCILGNTAWSFGYGQARHGAEAAKGMWIEARAYIDFSWIAESRKVSLGSPTCGALSLFVSSQGIASLPYTSMPYQYRLPRLGKHSTK